MHGMPIVGENKCGFCSPQDLQQASVIAHVPASQVAPTVGGREQYSSQIGFTNPLESGQASNKNVILIAIIGALVLILITIGIYFFSAQSSEKAMKQLEVSLTVIDFDMSNCLDLSLGYGDVPGATVTVSTEIKDVYGNLDEMGESSFGICEWKTTLLVPENAEQYGVTVGTRGTKYYSNSEIVSSNWKIELSLGS
jgi:hypothetical protein